MRSLLFRFTIRRSLALVAVVAALLALGVTGERLSRARAEYQRRAVRHAKDEKDLRDLLSHLEKSGLKDSLGWEIPLTDPEDEARLTALLSVEDQAEMKAFREETRREVETLKALKRELETIDKSARSEIAYHAGLKRKYRRASEHPWESLPPDAKDPGCDCVSLMGKWAATLMRFASDVAREQTPPGLDPKGVATGEGRARPTLTK